jgi:hypothetical protein
MGFVARNAEVFVGRMLNMKNKHENIARCFGTVGLLL